MSENSGGGSGNNGGLYLIVGGLVVIAGLGAFLYLGGDVPDGGSGTNTTIERTVTPDGSSSTTTTVKPD